MVIQIGNKFIISYIFEGNVITLDKSYEWSRWLVDIKACSSNTALSYARSMERFWIWSLYNKPVDGETFPEYFIKFKKKLIKGFTIKSRIVDELGEIEYAVYTSKPISHTTLSKELAGIESYLQYTNKEELVFSDEIDIGYEKRRSQSSFLASVGVKPSERFLKTFGKRKSFVGRVKQRPRSGIVKSAFPYKRFLQLLEVAKPREKMIYILAGITSARIGQILNLTLYDLDFNKKDVYLIDPKSDEKDQYNRSRRRWLLEKYGIDMDLPSEHNNSTNQFKYPIPYFKGPLHWINEDFKEPFFNALVQYTKSKYYVDEFERENPHPFLFVTSSGKRLTQNQVYETFWSNIKKLGKKYNCQDELKDVKGLHSLRHMAGTVMAQMYATSGKDIFIDLTKNMFGHASVQSTEVYFNILPQIQKKLLNEASKKVFK